ncbi:MAG: UvrD-helicase domain-containing protein, partial [Verrucomicrobiota bacterium]
PEEQANLLAREVLEAIMLEIYEGKTTLAAPVQRLVSEQGRGWDQPIRDLVKRIHAYQQTLPDPAGWFADQAARFDRATPEQWEQWFNEELLRWKEWWLPVLNSQDEGNIVAKICTLALIQLSAQSNRTDAATVFAAVLASESEWPRGKMAIYKEPIKKLFDEAEFLISLCTNRDGVDPLAQDWEWVKPQIQALLQLAQQFSGRFGKAKLEMAVLDFHDLEQFALELLWDRKDQKPSASAESWQKQLRLILVDEYQDINEAQDTILKALARDGSAANRFLVGDVKQSIYRFRLANPRIFLDYEQHWRHAPFSEVIALSDNFRSHEAILNFVNPLFAALIKKEIGGVDYDDNAKLAFGNRSGRAQATVAAGGELRVELHLRTTTKTDEPSSSDLESLSSAEKEARLIGLRLLELKNRSSAKPGVQGVEDAPQWSDMVILLRSPRNKTEAFAKEFSRLGIPLTTSRGGFYESLEVTDLLHLLRLLDNPLQDLPILAVLRSPFVGLSLDELAEIRLAHREGAFWTALLRWRELKASGGIDQKFFAKVDQFLEQWDRWRRLKKQTSLSQLFESILDETHYADWLQAQNRGDQRRANVERLLELTRQFDSLQGQGLFRFLRFVESQSDAEIDLEPAAV